ncbi:MAG: AbrB/MazE/SpoVT family DNA-binding domain-containing protein [Trueperaceae bacterium]|nr:MAG: AbrB/MazE/SpoVT family DNA-binding domain-containing protein [Trueperaceae bacterium]
MIQLKVRKIGNSLGVVLPKEVVQALHTAEGGTLHLTVSPDGGYRLTPYDPDFERKMRQVEDIAARYRDTLRVLSK